MSAPKNTNRDLVITRVSPLVGVGASLEMEGRKLAVVTEMLRLAAAPAIRVQVLAGAKEKIVDRVRAGRTRLVSRGVVTPIHGAVLLEDAGVLRNLGLQDTIVLQATGLDGRPCSVCTGSGAR